MMTYYESAKGVVISKARAIQEIYKHGIDDEGVQDFLADCGDKEAYSAIEVLNWLGY